MDFTQMPQPNLLRAYSKCKRYDKKHCINSNLLDEVAELEGRTVQFLHTYKGMVRWRELIPGRGWFRFETRLTPKYAAMIDDYDAFGKHFKPPKNVKNAMGPVICLGPSVERQDTPEVVAERHARRKARIASGELVPGSKFRERQTPYTK